MQSSFNITNILEKSFGAAAETYKASIVEWLASEYSFDANDAMSKLGSPQIIKTTKAKRTAVPKEPKAPSAPKPCCVLPYHPRGEGYCQALRLDHGLYTQCANHHLTNGEYCKTCQRQVDSKGIAPYGTVNDRGERGSYVAPDGKREKTYGTVLKALNVSEETARAEVSKYGIEVAESEYNVVVGKRGRPKGVGVSDTESSESSTVGHKKRGRPRKVETVEVAGEDLISSLIAQVNGTKRDTIEPESVNDISILTDSDTEPDTEPDDDDDIKIATPVEQDIKESEKAEAKAAKKAAKADEKAAEKEAKAAAKAAEKEAKAAEKEAKAAPMYASQVPRAGG